MPTPPAGPRVAALLPMKRHSARIPGKNFRLFLGRPLFHWVLDTLLAVDEVTRVVINTDAQNELRRCGLPASPRVALRRRRPELCGDRVSMNRVIADDLAHVPADVYLMTHATNPLLQPDTVRRALARFLASAAQGTHDSLFTVNRHQTRFYRADGTPLNHDPQHLVPTQELEPWYEENSNLYIFTRESFRRTGARIGRRPLMFETPRRESIDIDDRDDWDLARRLCRRPPPGLPPDPST